MLFCTEILGFYAGRYPTHLGLPKLHGDTQNMLVRHVWQVLEEQGGQQVEDFWQYCLQQAKHHVVPWAWDGWHFAFINNVWWLGNFINLVPFPANTLDICKEMQVFAENKSQKAFPRTRYLLVTVLMPTLIKALCQLVTSIFATTQVKLLTLMDVLHS